MDEQIDKQIDEQIDEQSRLIRWRLVLGAGTESTLGCSLDETWQRCDAALEYIYSREYGEERNVRGESRQGGTGASQLTIPQWINEVHTLFPKETIERIEKDALERYQIQEMVTNPELLKRATPNVHLVKAVLQTKHLMNKEVLSLAIELVRRVIDDLMKQLAQPVQSAFLGSIQRQRRSFLKVAKNFDPKRTIERNLASYQPEEKKLYIKTPYFFSRTHRQMNRWQIIILVDESGSMLDSVIYSAITAAIFFGLKTVKTHLCLFDTEVVDVSQDCQDPVETIMKVQLGGGTDIARAVTYASQLIENPRRTIVVLITDFFEGGSVARLLGLTKQMVESGVTFLGLAALDDKANPCYNKEVAQSMVDRGAHVGAMTPGQLAQWVAEKIQG